MDNINYKIIAPLKLIDGHIYMEETEAQVRAMLSLRLTRSEDYSPLEQRKYKYYFHEELLS